MRVFLYEFISGGGCFHPSIAEAPQGSLLVEGLAMWQAAYDDFSSIEDVEVVTTRDARLPSLELPHIVQVHGYDTVELVNLAKPCDFALVIAPEFEGHLLGLLQAFDQRGCKRLGCSVTFAQICSNKTATADRLRETDVNVPSGQLIQTGDRAPANLRYPAVLKLNDGAGSMGRIVTGPPANVAESAMRIEELVRGTPCSQSFICTSSGERIACPPLRQLISDDGRLRYLGGERLMDPSLIQRATSTAEKTLLALPATTGYVGVDMVLGDDGSGHDDYVIEVNPRLTTSYIGLRQLSKTNLAKAMLDAVTGTRPTLQFHSTSIRFQADGTIQQ